jgi:hypothetical protein
VADSTSKTAARPLRIYEYITADGVVFWSTTRLEGLQTQRMVLTDIRGTYFRKFISDVHHLALFGPADEDGK